jgi:hypothetical protein
MPVLPIPYYLVTIALLVMSLKLEGLLREGSSPNKKSQSRKEKFQLQNSLLPAIAQSPTVVDYTGRFLVI